MGTGQDALPRSSKGPTKTQLPKLQLMDARGELDSIFESLLSLNFADSAPVQGLKERQQRWVDGQLRVLLVGDFSSGKSTLLNILAGRLIADTGCLPTTMALQEITCGEQKNIVLVDSPGINAAEGQRPLGGSSCRWPQVTKARVAELEFYLLSQ